MKVFLMCLGLTLAAITPASAQWGVQTWGYSTVPGWGAPGYGSYGYGYGPPPAYDSRGVPYVSEWRRQQWHREREQWRREHGGW